MQLNLHHTYNPNQTNEQKNKSQKNRKKMRIVKKKKKNSKTELTYTEMKNISIIESINLHHHKTKKHLEFFIKKKTQKVK